MPQPDEKAGAFFTGKAAKENVKKDLTNSKISAAKPSLRIIFRGGFANETSSEKSAGRVAFTDSGGCGKRGAVCPRPKAGFYTSAKVGDGISADRAAVHGGKISIMRTGEAFYMLPFRLVRIKRPNGNVEVLVTNLDVARFPPKELKSFMICAGG